jgi:DNA polymerase elongation subunit (family B)
MSQHVLETILSGDERENIVRDIHDYVTDMAARINDPEQRQVPLSKYVITKSLTKEPETVVKQGRVSAAETARPAGAAIAAPGGFRESRGTST